MIDTIIIVVCGVLALGLTALLIWWLKVGKRCFIAKRCPERLVISGTGTGKKLKHTKPNSLLNADKTGVNEDGNGESDNEREGTP